jgi:hypothetical protein
MPPSNLYATPKTPAQTGGFLSNLFGKSYGAGGNYGNLWETPIGKGMLPMVSQLASANPLIGTGVMAAGMGPSDWKTLMSKSTPGSARLGGFNRSVLSKFDKSQSAKPLAKYGLDTFMYKFGQEPKPAQIPLVQQANPPQNLPVQQQPAAPLLYDPTKNVNAPDKSVYPRTIEGLLGGGGEAWRSEQLLGPQATVKLQGQPDQPQAHISPDLGNKYYQPDERQQQAISSYLSGVPIYGGWAVDDQGNPVWVRGSGASGSGLGETAGKHSLSDTTHPFTNHTFTTLSNQMRDRGYGIQETDFYNRRMAGSSPITEEEMAQYFAGRAQEGGAKRYDAQGNEQTGDYARDSYNRRLRTPSDKGYVYPLDVQSQRQQFQLNAPDFREDTTLRIPSATQGMGFTESGADQTFPGVGSSKVDVDPMVTARIRAAQIYPNYKKWYDSQAPRTGSGIKHLINPLIPGKVGNSPGSQATHRPFEVYADDLPSQLMNYILMGKMTGQYASPMETEARYGIGGHRLMAGQDAHLQGIPGNPQYIPGWQPQRWQEVPLERQSVTPGQKRLEGAIDFMSLGKNWGNYGLGGSIVGDPRYVLSKGLQLPFQVAGGAQHLAGQTWNQGAVQTGKDLFSSAGQAMNAPANLRKAYDTYKATQQAAGQVALGRQAYHAATLARMLNPFSQAMRGMGYGDASHLVDAAGKLRPWKTLSQAERAGISALRRNWNVLRGPTQYAKSIPGTGLLSKIPLPGFSRLATPLPGRLGTAMSKIRATGGVAGRALGALEGLRVVLGEPAEEALALWNAKNAAEQEQILRAGSQGRWGENYRRAEGLVRPDMNQWIDKDKDGTWDTYTEGPNEGEKIPNPHYGKQMVGFDWTGKTEINPTLNRYIQKALLGMEQPHNAIQETFAGLADLAGSGARGLGLAENPQWGKFFSNPDKDIRFGFDLTENQPMSDYYTEGTYENFKARLPNAERGLEQYERLLAEGGGERFADPHPEEIDQGLPREQLVNFFVDQFVPSKDSDGNEVSEYDRRSQAAWMVGKLPREEYDQAIQHIQERAYTPSGHVRVGDDAVERKQVYGWLLDQHGDATRDSVDDRPFFRDEDGREVPLKELDNKAYVHGKDSATPGKPYWSVGQNKDGTPKAVGFRDYHLNLMRVRQNQAYQKGVYNQAQTIFANGKGTITAGKAWELANNANPYPTMAARIQYGEESGQWSKDHPTLAHDVIREELQSKITEMSPYRPDVIRQQMLDAHQTNERGTLEQLRREVRDLPAQIESKRDVTEGVTYNEDTRQQVQQQRSTAIERMHELNESIPEDKEKLKEWRREFNHNKGIVQAADGFSDVYKKNRFLGGSTSATGESNRKNMAGVGQTIQTYESYNPLDKTRGILENINRNKGRRAMWDTLKKVQDQREAARRSSEVNSVPTGGGFVPF